MCSCPSEATILHADLDAFYASVEQRDDPRLRGRPVIVGGGVVLAASYEAKACGVRTAMGGAQARRLCPQAIVVPPRMSAYSEASKAVFEVFDDTTPLVEGLSIDEAFLDVGGLRRISGTPAEIAARLRREVLERVGLPITVGVARTKFLAKVASGVAKPDGLLVVPPDGELAFLHPLPVERLWGVGPVTAAKLHDRGITTRRRGRPARRAGAGVAARAGVGPPPPRAGPQPRSPAGAGRAAAGARSGRSARSAAARRSPGDARRRPGRPRRPRRPGGCAPPAGRAARSCCACASTTSPARPARTPLPQATAQTQPILATARALLDGGHADDRAPGPHAGRHGAAQPRRRRRRPARAAVRPATRHALDAALDDVRDRFGSAAITRAVLLGRDQGLSVPLLPD